MPPPDHHAVPGVDLPQPTALAEPRQITLAQNKLRFKSVFLSSVAKGPCACWLAASDFNHCWGRAGHSCFCTPRWGNRPENCQHHRQDYWRQDQYQVPGRLLSHWNTSVRRFLFPTPVDQKGIPAWLLST